MPGPDSPSVVDSPPLRSDARRNRDAVVAAALRVLAERPDATMGEIAEASRVGRTTLYRHFASREELVDALTEQAQEEAVALVQATAKSPEPALDALARLCRDLVALGDRYRFVLATIRPDSERPTTRLVGYVRAAQRRGELRNDLPAKWIVETLSALVRTAFAEISGGHLTPQRAGDALSSTFVSAVAPR